MFLPEDLLFKQGALAHVWLASNQQKKLTKAQVLQHKIPESCEVIIRPEATAGGPLALRLNAQLLLGEVRIYHKKAHYLQDDCNEALWKIKMAFRPGNIDLPAHTHVANPANLILPDQITAHDLFAAMPDPESLLSHTLGGNFGFADVPVPDWDDSQFLSGSVEQPRREHIEIADEDLQLDIGEGDDVIEDPLGYDEGTSIEVGRNAPLERRQSEEFSTMNKNLMDIDDDLGLYIGEDEPTDLPGAPELDLGDDLDITMGGTDLDLPAGLPADDQTVRREDSPLSELGDQEATRLEQEIAEQNTTAFEPEQEQEEEESVHQARAKRRRVIGADAETMISSHQLREQQNNRDKILRPASFLPRDPLLMALMNMQKSGGFVSSILGDGRSQGWAPELRGILSLEVISRPTQKRKRDAIAAGTGVTEEEEEAAEAEQTPQLEIPQDDTSIAADIGIGGDGNTTLPGNDDIVQLLDEPAYEEAEDVFSPVPDNFDDTTAPLVHPAEAGPISLGTKHAVHLLREHFGPEAEESESERQKSSIVFQDVFPESRTSRGDATKMFFEMLVLATKDAIKVEQPPNELGGPLRIRAKRGLWGQWAETGAGGELASQPQATPTGDPNAPAEAIFQGPPEVSVSA